MAARTRTVRDGGQYKGHNYRVEQQMTKTLDGEGEFPSRVDVYVDNNSIILSEEFRKSIEKFTIAEQSVQAAKAHIDQLEAQKELDKLEDQKHPDAKIVWTIGGASVQWQKHYEPK